MRLAQCPDCIGLEAKFKDPATPNPGAYLYAWATHHIRDHNTQPLPRKGCKKCAQFTSPIWGVHERLRKEWGRLHFMQCVLAPRWMDDAYENGA